MKMGDRTSQKTNRLLETVNRYHIRTNPAPEAVFSFAIGTLTIWCTPEDNPGGLWKSVNMYDPFSQLTKPASGLADCHLLWSEEAQELAGLSLRTRAHTLFSAGLIPEEEIENRPDDLSWATHKLEWLWQQAFPGEPTPKILLKSSRDEPLEDFTDFF